MTNNIMFGAFVIMGICVISFMVWLVVWLIAEFRKDDKEYEEAVERIRKAKPLTGTAKEVFIGTYCAKSLY